MNNIGVFKDHDYMSFSEYDELMALEEWRESSLGGFMESVGRCYQPYKPVKLEFMDYVAKGVKNFLKSPFHHGVEWEYKGDL
jgi:hypothetical protein|tara:strand:+ start:152 stop:397 length:246 start_codon:yes stop_codon:yes gene_type:complete